ncbi:DEAD-box ATP-dependent RNA helicase 37, partial [Linum grandiflorum]
ILGKIQLISPYYCKRKKSTPKGALALSFPFLPAFLIHHLLQTSLFSDPSFSSIAMSWDFPGGTSTGGGAGGGGQPNYSYRGGAVGGRGRPQRGHYVPPYQRNLAPTPQNVGYGYSPYSTTAYGGSPTPAYGQYQYGGRSVPGQPDSFVRGRGRGGGVRGRGGRGRSGREEYGSSVSDAILEKFDDLDVADDVDEVNNGGINFEAYNDIPVKASGTDVPPPAESFEEIDLEEGLIENVRRCKYTKPTPIQKHAIPIAVAGRDLMACAQTGSGKTAAFCFPIISKVLKNGLQSGRGGTRMAQPCALILSPTRELSCQIHDEAKKFAYKTGVKIVVVYGGAPIHQQLYNMEKGVDILVATPGRLVDMIERGRVSLKMIKHLAVDEADRMLDMGFEPQIRKIVQQMGMPPPGQRQTMLFSATFPDEIQRLASDFLSNYIFLSVGRVGSSTGLISQKVELVQDMDKRSHIMKLLHARKTNGKSDLTLVFTETKKGADALEDFLYRNGFPAIAIHGDKVQPERERALRSFKSGVTPILVATDVASRGLDIPNVSHVINYDMPKDIDDYVHRIGRTGRAGKSGQATAFFSNNNMSMAKPLVELMKESKQEVPSWLSEYAESENSSNYSGGSRYRRYGGGGSSRHGGYDYRNDYSSNSYGGYNAAPYYDSNGYAAGYTVPNAGGGGEGGYGLGTEAVVASGWDM